MASPPLYTMRLGGEAFCPASGTSPEQERASSSAQLAELVATHLALKEAIKWESRTVSRFHRFLTGWSGPWLRDKFSRTRPANLGRRDTEVTSNSSCHCCSSLRTRSALCTRSHFQQHGGSLTEPSALARQRLLREPILPTNSSGPTQPQVTGEFLY